MTERDPIILCCGRGLSFPWEQELHLLNMGVVLAYNGYDEAGRGYDPATIEIKRDRFPGLPHIIPLKPTTAISGGNEYKWDRILHEWKANGPISPVAYVRDEIFNRELWGCPYNPYTQRVDYMNWKRAQVIECQKAVNNAVAYIPNCRPMVTSDKPVPPGSKPIEAPGLIRAYDLRHIQLAYDHYGSKWRKQYGIKELDPVYGYLIKPIWGCGFAPADIGPFCRLHHLAGFLYYNATDPDICDNGRPTTAMLELHKGMAR